MIMKYFILFLLAANFVFAGGHVVGNGGYVIKCNKNAVETFESYDLVEGFIIDNKSPVFSLEKDYLNKAKDILRRIKNLNPTRFHLYTEWLNNFKNEAMYTPSGVDLIDIPDVSIGVRPKGCSLVQAIVQNTGAQGKESRYLINSDIWNKLDEDHKSALVIHELIYREARNNINRHENSFYVRSFNQLIFSDQIKNMKLKNYILFLKDSFFAQADAYGISIMLFNFNSKNNVIYSYPLEFWSDDSLKMAHIYLNGSFKANGITANYTCLDRIKQIFHDDFQVHFYENHKVKSIVFPSVDEIKEENVVDSCVGGVVDLNQYGFAGSMAANNFEFDSSGNLLLATAQYYNKGQILNLDEGGKSLKVQVISSAPQSDVVTLKPFAEIVFSTSSCSSQRDWVMSENGKTLAKNILKIEKNKISGENNYFFCSKRKI